MPNPYVIADAINQVAEVLIPFPMYGTDLAAGDETSVYAIAKQFLSRARVDVCSVSTEHNTQLAKEYTLDAGGKATLTQAPNAYAELAIKAAGPDQYRTLVLRWDSTATAQMRPYDADKGTFALGTPTTGKVWLDVTVLLPWESLNSRMAEQVIARAKLAFQRRYAPEQLKDMQLQQEYQMSGDASRRPGDQAPPAGMDPRAMRG
jgi:hypothetical protein